MNANRVHELRSKIYRNEGINIPFEKLMHELQEIQREEIRIYGFCDSNKAIKIWEDMRK